MAYFILAFLLVLADQALKLWVVDHIPLHHHIDFIPPLMDLTYVQNTGAAFSMLSNFTWALTIVSGFLSVGLAVALKLKFFSRPLGQLALSLVLAGAVGNLIDRAFRGFVVDMFNLMFIRFAVFNIADVCVVFGGLLAGYYYIFFYDKYDAVNLEEEEGKKTTEESAEESTEESSEEPVNTPSEETTEISGEGDKKVDKGLGDEK